MRRRNLIFGPLVVAAMGSARAQQSGSSPHRLRTSLASSDPTYRGERIPAVNTYHVVFALAACVFVVRLATSDRRVTPTGTDRTLTLPAVSQPRLLRQAPGPNPGRSRKKGL